MLSRLSYAGSPLPLAPKYILVHPSVKWRDVLSILCVCSSTIPEVFARLAKTSTSSYCARGPTAGGPSAAAGAAEP